MSHMYWIVWIVAIVMVANVAQQYLKSRTDRRQSDEESEATAKKLDELEERIRVLERIVTEKSYDLRKEINQL